jgi:hypothetical protein
MVTSSSDALQGSGGAGLYAEGIALAEIAFHGLFHLGADVYDAQRAMGGTGAAADAGIVINVHHTGGLIPGYGLDRADPAADGVGALLADKWLVNEVLLGMHDAQHRAPGIEPSGYPLRAGQLTNSAAGAEIKVGFEKGVNSSILHS